MIDHILLGTSELSHGIDYVFQKTGIKANFGGEHPAWGTHNALLSLGSDTYLEIISPQPGLVSKKPFEFLPLLARPGLITWAAKTEYIETIAIRLNLLEVEHSGVLPGSRLQSNGEWLRWKILFPKKIFEGVLPFFIQWEQGNPHPARSSPLGLLLKQFDLYHPEANQINKIFKALEMEECCAFSMEVNLEAKLESPKGDVTFNSH